MRRSLLVPLLLALFLSACGPSPTPEVVVVVTATPTYTATPTETPLPTDTPTPAPTSTPVPLVDLEGLLFFDYNGSGLREDSEPPIAGFGVCARILGQQEEVCLDTDENGRYVFESLAPRGTRISLRFVDPNSDDPASAFRYINVWRGPVVIPSYEMNGVQVPEQHLNDTEIRSLEQGILIVAGEYNATGLMQGFLTLPYRSEDAHLYWLSNYCDLDVDPGSVRNYAGNATMIGDPSQYPDIDGTSDQHYGVDWEGPEGAWVTSPAPGVIGYVGIHATVRSKAVAVLHDGIESTVGHLDEWVVEMHQVVHRGQIIGVNGMTGTSHPHIHFGLYDLETGPASNPPAIDPFMDSIERDFRYEEYPDRSGQRISIGSPGFWTVANDPRFSR